MINFHRICCVSFLTWSQGHHRFLQSIFQWFFRDFLMRKKMISIFVQPFAWTIRHLTVGRSLRTIDEYLIFHPLLSTFFLFSSLFLFFPFLSSLFFPTSWTIFLNDTRIIKKNTRERGIGKKLSSRDHDVKNISFFLSLEIYEGGIEDNSRSESESETGTELGGRKSASSACIVKSRVFFFFFSFFFSPFFFVYVCICMRVRVCLFIIFISLVKMQSMRLGNQARLLIIEQSFCETIFLIFFFEKSIAMIWKSNGEILLLLSIYLFI